MPSGELDVHVRRRAVADVAVRVVTAGMTIARIREPAHAAAASMCPGEPAAVSVRSRAMAVGLTLHFHPDRKSAGATVIDALARDGVYRNQFETGTSNGGVTAFPGGDRWRWESRLFAQRYDAAPAAARPLYGSWNRHGDPYGGSPRFGSAYLRLRDDVVERATFCFPDSADEPTLFGGSTRLAELCAAADAASLDVLDDYVEAQVHGGVMVSRDVDAVVLDHCFRDSPIEDAARRLGCAVEFHPGFCARTADLDAQYRTPAAVLLARSLGATITPATVGVAANSGLHDQQLVKHVWHLLARYGRAIAGQAARRADQ